MLVPFARAFGGRNVRKRRAGLAQAENGLNFAVISVMNLVIMMGEEFCLPFFGWLIAYGANCCCVFLAKMGEFARVQGHGRLSENWTSIRGRVGAALSAYVLV